MLVRRLALALSFAVAAPLGCSPSTEVKRIRTPREGVTLAYDFSVGQGYEGKLHVGNTRAIDGLDAPLSQTATCDVNMVVIGEVPEGTEIRTTFTSIDLDWDLPPSATYSSAELLELAHDRLRGMQVQFVIRKDGRLHAMPALPPDAPPELVEVIESLLQGLEAFFVPLPPTPLTRRDDQWTKSFAHETGSGLKMEMDHELQAQGQYAHRDDDQQYTRLMIEQRRREQRNSAEGPVMVERKMRALMMFATDGYPAEVDRETREFDPEHGITFRKTRAEWSRFRGLVPELIAPVTGDVQVIKDPCNPDYVGPEECEDQPEPAPKPEPEPEQASDSAEDATAPGPDEAAADDAEPS